MIFIIPALAGYSLTVTMGFEVEEWKRYSYEKTNLATRIYFVRGEKAMVDFAMLYGVKTAQLKRAVRRNLERFPSDFMFELTREELENLGCQIGIPRPTIHTKDNQPSCKTC